MTTTEAAQYLSDHSGLDAEQIKSSRTMCQRARGAALAEARRVIHAKYQSHNDTAFVIEARKIGQAFETVVEGMGK